MRRSRRRPLPLPALLCGLVLAPFPAAAGLLTDVSFNRGTTEFCEDFGGEFAATGCTFQGVTGEARAGAGPGSLTAWARLASSNSTSGIWEAWGQSRFSDTWTILVPSAPMGANFVAEVDVTLTGLFATDASQLTSGTIGGSIVLSLDVNDVFAGTTALVGTGVQDTFDFGFQNGVPFDVEFMLTATASCTSCVGGYERIVDAENTGTVDLVRVRFQELGAFTVTSGEGERYANVVPEPGTLPLAGAGLALIGLARRRGSRS